MEAQIKRTAHSDSAIGNSEAVSTARKTIIAEAKGLLSNRTEEEETAVPVAAVAVSAAVSAAAQTSAADAAAASESPRRTKEKALFAIGDVDANVRAFLDRMRHQG